MTPASLASQRHGSRTPALPPDSRWTPLCRAGSRNRNALWLCRCACGHERVVMRKELTNGNSRSCGCLRACKASVRPLLHASPEQLCEYDLMVRALRKATGCRQLTLKEIALVLGVSKERVRQIETRARAKLHAAAGELR